MTSYKILQFSYFGDGCYVLASQKITVPIVTGLLFMADNTGGIVEKVIGDCSSFA
jgi:hypothetical protein